MFIGCIRAQIFIPHSRSLKDKRRIISSVKQRAKDTFNVALAEKPLDKWQRCELCFVCVNYTKGRVHEIMSHVEEFIRVFRDIQLLDIESEIF